MISSTNLTFFAFLTSIVGCVRCTHRLQILHTNDMHAHFSEVDEYASSCPPKDAEAHKCFGGFARIRDASIKAKNEAQVKNISSIFLNAGDTFQGTPYYTVYKWKVAASLFNTLEFDAMCLGNHEFDDGVDNLVEYLAHVKTPAVTANLNRTSETRLNETNVKNSVVLEVDGVKIGIVGYLTPETMISSRTEKLQILDEIPSIQAEAKRLKSEGIKIIIGLGHSGLRMDQKIAAEVEDIDIIVGGHSHSLLYTPSNRQPNTEKVDESYPCWVTQKSGKRVPIVQSSAYTKYFGRLIVTFDDDWKVVSAEGNSHLLDHKYKKNTDVENLVDSWTFVLRKYLRTVVGNTRVLLKRSDLKSSDLESNMANLITDALFDAGIVSAKQNNLSQWTENLVAVQQNGGIRSQISKSKNQGNFTLEDLLIVLPFENEICQCRINGENLKKILELSVNKYEPKEKHIPYFLHFSGLRVTYNLKKPVGDRVASVEILCKYCSVPKYEKLKENETYWIMLNDYLLQGADNYYIFKTECKDVKRLGYVAADAVLNYVEKQQVIYPKLDGRLKVLGYGEASTATRTKFSRCVFMFAFVYLSFLIIT